MKVLVTILLSLCFLLLRGGNHVYAHTSHQRIGYSPALLKEREHKSATAGMKTGHSTIGTTAASNAGDDAVSATETDDEDWTPTRKCSLINKFSLSFFYGQPSPRLFRNFNNGLPYCTQPSYTPTHRYIVQRVIRI